MYQTIAGHHSHTCLCVACVCMCSAYGQGYSWSPATVIASVGDTVVWRWQAPAFVEDLGYRVFSADSPSSTEFDGVTFNSGNSKTTTGTQTMTSYVHSISPVLNENFLFNVKPKYLSMTSHE